MLSFKRSPHLIRNVIVENHCLIQWSLFDVRNFFSVLATPLHSNSMQDVDENAEQSSDL